MKKKKNCSVQLCRPKYLPAGFCSLSSVKVSTGDQSQGFCNNQMQTACLAVIGSDSLFLLQERWHTECFQHASHDMSDVWLMTRQKQPSCSFFFFLIAYDLKMKGMERNEKYFLNARKTILRGH